MTYGNFPKIFCLAKNLASNFPIDDLMSEFLNIHSFIIFLKIGESPLCIGPRIGHVYYIV